MPGGRGTLSDGGRRRVGRGSDPARGRCPGGRTSGRARCVRRPRWEGWFYDAIHASAAGHRTRRFRSPLGGAGVPCRGSGVGAAEVEFPLYVARRSRPRFGSFYVMAQNRADSNGLSGVRSDPAVRAAWSACAPDGSCPRRCSARCSPRTLAPTADRPPGGAAGTARARRARAGLSGAPPGAPRRADGHRQERDRARGGGAAGRGAGGARPQPAGAARPGGDAAHCRRADALRGALDSCRRRARASCCSRSSTAPSATFQQPALQLLTARTLHEYQLPDGWVCFAAVAIRN